MSLSLGFLMKRMATPTTACCLCTRAFQLWLDILLFVCRITRARAGSADMEGEDEVFHFPVLIPLCHSLTPSPPPAHSLFARLPLTFFWGRWVIFFQTSKSEKYSHATIFPHSQEDKTIFPFSLSFSFSLFSFSFFSIFSPPHNLINRRRDDQKSTRQ